MNKFKDIGSRVREFAYAASQEDLDHKVDHDVSQQARSVITVNHILSLRIIS